MRSVDSSFEVSVLRKVRQGSFQMQAMAALLGAKEKDVKDNIGVKILKETMGISIGN